ncbi:hypothetical protein HBB16_05120 [Pseudonocardia sp. MCCB 268]|nr:hypothetical protein [Pseudonocardia cytotoxica]
MTDSFDVVVVGALRRVHARRPARQRGVSARRWSRPGTWSSRRTPRRSPRPPPPTPGHVLNCLPRDPVRQGRGARCRAAGVGGSGAINGGYLSARCRPISPTGRSPAGPTTSAHVRRLERDMDLHVRGARRRRPGCGSPGWPGTLLTPVTDLFLAGLRHARLPGGADKNAGGPWAPGPSRPTPSTGAG